MDENEVVNNPLSNDLSKLIFASCNSRVELERLLNTYKWAQVKQIVNEIRNLTRQLDSIQELTRTI